MKRLLWLWMCVALATVALGQTTPAPALGPKDRLFFPSDTFWGYGQFEIAPPHNEIDPNLCRADAGNFGGANAPCNAFARYMISGYVEVRPFGRTQLRRLFFFGEPNFLFGKSVPQTLYTWSFDAIGWERSWGAGVYIGKVICASVPKSRSPAWGTSYLPWVQGPMSKYWGAFFILLSVTKLSQVLRA